MCCKLAETRERDRFSIVGSSRTQIKMFTMRQQNPCTITIASGDPPPGRRATHRLAFTSVVPTNITCMRSALETFAILGAERLGSKLLRRRPASRQLHEQLWKRRRRLGAFVTSCRRATPSDTASGGMAVVPTGLRSGGGGKSLWRGARSAAMDIQTGERAPAPAQVLPAPSAPRTMTMARSGANVYSPLLRYGEAVRQLASCVSVAV